MRIQKIALVLLACAVFGCLMAVRDMSDNVGWRAMIAALAGGGLALVLGLALVPRARA